MYNNVVWKVQCPKKSVMRGHMTWQVMPFSERFIADGALELLFAPPLDQWFHGIFLFVVRTHVVHQVRGHAERGIAFRTPVLCWQAERGEGRGQECKGRWHLQLNGAWRFRPKCCCVEEWVLLWHATWYRTIGAQFRTLQLGSQVISLIKSTRSDGVTYRRVAVYARHQLGRHDKGWKLWERTWWLAEGTLALRASGILGYWSEGARYNWALDPWLRWLCLTQHLPNARMLLAARPHCLCLILWVETTIFGTML